MSIIKEFKEFAFKGNVLDMAVGVIIGGAFGKIVTSLVNDIIMPMFSLLLNDIKFTDLVVPLKGDSAIMVGNFIQSFVDFIIIAISIFAFIKIINSFKKKKEEAPEEPAPKAPTAEELLTEIRDLLKKEQ